MKTAIFSVCVLVGVLLVALPASATTITWGAAQNIGAHGDSDVSLDGTLDRAYNFGLSATTVNGVTFSNFSGQTTDTANGTNYTGGFCPPVGTGLTSGYVALLNGCLSGTSNVTLKNLDASKTYEIQVWANDSRSNYGWTRWTTIDGSPELTFNVGASGTGLGQYAIGKFTGTTSLSMSFTSNVVNQINALELRQVPEPGMVALLGTALIGLLAYAWRRRK